MPEQNTDEATIRPSRALVLGGGGGRGAYGVGVMKAFQERDFKFDWVIGTSIGAINAALFAQGDLDVLEEVWSRVSSEDVYKLPNPQHLRHLFFGERLGFLDTSPLEELLNKYVDVNKLRNCDFQIGFVTTDLCSLQTKVFFKEDIQTKAELVDILMAASAVPLLFPPRILETGGCWMDGGLVTNTPIQAAINLGAKEVYAVIVEPDPVEEVPNSIPKLIGRLIEILLDQTANTGIAQVNFFNRRHRLDELTKEFDEKWCRLEDSAQENPKKLPDDLIAKHASINKFKDELQSVEKVSLFLIKPPNKAVGSLLEIDPITSKWLMRMGYEDAVSNCIHVTS